MEKKKIRPSPYLFPMPTVLVGANVNGKPNFVTIAFCGSLQYKPPMLVISSGKNHFTNIGIRENNTFSVNIPSIEMVEVTDYIGTKSGKQIDKSNLFEIFYGDLENAPMISEAPVNHECKVVKIIDLKGTNDIIIGEIVQTYVNEECITNGKPDIQKIQPILFSGFDANYMKVGDILARAYKVGRNYKKE
ncbi:MAG: flavin reductase family protein [Candidatus Hodarchaeota archaeon]